jgi:hypothetical protein
VLSADIVHVLHCTILYNYQPDTAEDAQLLIQVCTYDTAVVAALAAATSGELLYQKARAARAVTAAAATATAVNTGTSTQQAVVISKAKYATMAPSDFDPVLNW